MRVFWEQGYEGASLTDLTSAMGITRTSMYAAFGNKEELFLKALQRYTEGPASYAARALQAPTARAVATAVLAGSVRAIRPVAPAAREPCTPRHPVGQPGRVLARTAPARNAVATARAVGSCRALAA